MTVPTTLELVTRAPNGFGITEPSHVQEAICLAMDGLCLGNLWEEPDVRAVFGGERPEEHQPDMVLLVAASRALKTKMIAAKGVQTGMSCDMRSVAEGGYLSPGDEIRLSVIGPTMDKAAPAFTNMYALATRAFPGFVEKPLVRSFHLRRSPDFAIEVTGSALTKEGGGVIARWSASAIFTEATRMVGEEEGEVNLEETLANLENRMLPGAIRLLEGSPWAPWGPIHKLDRENFGKPTRGLLVIRANGPQLWPRRYTKEYCDMMAAKPDKRAHQADVLGLYVDPEDSAIPTVTIDAAIDKGIARRTPRKDKDGNLTHKYTFAMDPATRRNTWTLTGICCTAENRFEQAYLRSWTGTPSAPLKPSALLREARDDMKEYGENEAHTDQASFDALADTGEELGKLDIAEGKPDGGPLYLLFVPSDDTDLDCDKVQNELREQHVRLLDDEPQRTDLQRIKTRAKTDGTTRYHLPEVGGRHCDTVPALGKCLRYPPDPPAKAPAEGPPPYQPKSGNAQRDMVRTLTG